MTDEWGSATALADPVCRSDLDAALACYTEASRHTLRTKSIVESVADFSFQVLTTAILHLSACEERRQESAS